MSEPRLRYGRVIGFGLLAEVATAVIIVSVLQVHARFIAPGDVDAIATFTQRAPAILGPGLGILFTFLAAQWAARPVPTQAVAHGVAVGVVTSLLTVPGMFMAPSMIPIYAGAIVLKIAAGWAAGATIEWRGKPGVTVAQYIAKAPPKQRKALKQLRAAIRRATPAVTERISYRIPVFEVDGKFLLYIAAFKEHVSVYPVTAAIVKQHGKAIERFRHGRGTLRFGLDDRIPVSLVEKLAKTRARERRVKS